MGLGAVHDTFGVGAFSLALHFRKRIVKLSGIHGVAVVHVLVNAFTFFQFRCRVSHSSGL